MAVIGTGAGLDALLSGIQSYIDRKVDEKVRAAMAGLVKDVSQTINLEPPCVTAFMADAYDDSIATKGKTKVDSYLADVVEGSHPSPTEVTAPVVVGKEGDVVRLMLDGAVTEYAGGEPIYNLVPQRTYECTVMCQGRMVGAGTIKTEGHVRMLNFDDPQYPIVNARDLGGYLCKGGRTRYNMIFRSAVIPEGVTYDSQCAETLRGLGVTDEIDIYGVYPHGDCGWNYTYLPFSSYQTTFNNAALIKAFFKKLLAVLEGGGRVLLHCQAGADRTGTFGVVLFLLLGVSISDMVHDYELTSMSCWINRKRVNEDGLQNFFTALKPYKGSTYHEKMHWWMVNKAGITEDEISRLKALLIEPDTADEVAPVTEPLTVTAAASSFAYVDQDAYNAKDVQAGDLNAVQTC